MKAEKIILSFFALLTGLIVAGIGFYFVQSSQVNKTPTSKKTTQAPSATPTPVSSLFLSIDSPKDRVVVSKKSLQVSGKTQKDAIIVISTPLGDTVVSPTQKGDFSATISIDDGENAVYYTAIAPTGDEKQLVQTITYSTEDF